MLPRRAVTCLNTCRLSSKCGKAIRHGRPQRRLSSTSASSAPGAPFTVASPAAPLASITGELDKLTPRFDVSAEDIEILRSPSDFFETLKEKISKAQDRIYLSTLYVGKTEHELVGSLTPQLICSVVINIARSQPFAMHSKQIRTSRSLFSLTPSVALERNQIRHAPAFWLPSSRTLVLSVLKSACITRPT